MTAHVLDPLTSAEIASFVAAVRASDRIGARPRFWGISLDEEKAKALKPGDARPVRLVVMNPDAHASWEVRGWTAGPTNDAIVEVWSDVDHRRPGGVGQIGRLRRICHGSISSHAALATHRAVISP